MKSVRSSVVERMLGGGYCRIRPVQGASNDNVFVGFDNKYGTKVFIKLVDGTRYRRELNVFALPVRDQIVAPQDTVFLDNARCALIYPWFSSGSLRKWFRRRSIWTPDLVKRLASDLLMALRCLHSQRMLHGDLKPENILVKREGNTLRFYLSDFGSSAYFQELEQQKWRSASPAYEAPESVEGHPTLRSDLYSLGVVLLEALRGRAPNRGMPSAIYRQARFTIPGLSDISCPLQRSLLSRLLQNESKYRPEHANEALALLVKGPVACNSVLPQNATVVPAGLVKRHAYSSNGFFDTVTSSDDGRFVAFQAECRLSVQRVGGVIVDTVACSSVPPVWHDDSMYYVQGADLWKWRVDSNRTAHIRWLRHVPDAIAMSAHGEAWLSNHWLFRARRGSGEVAKIRLEGFVRSDLIAMAGDRCYVVEGNLRNRLVCRDPDLKVRWVRDLDGVAEALRVTPGDRVRLVLRSLDRPVAFEAQTLENGICRQRIELDRGTRQVSLTRHGCIVWLQNGRIRMYSFAKIDQTRCDQFFQLEFSPGSVRPIAPVSEPQSNGELQQ